MCPSAASNLRPCCFVTVRLQMLRSPCCGCRSSGALGVGRLHVLLVTTALSARQLYVAGVMPCGHLVHAELAVAISADMQSVTCARLQGQQAAAAGVSPTEGAGGLWQRAAAAFGRRPAAAARSSRQRAGS